MTDTVLLTLGRLPKCLDLARGFRALGWRVVVAEPFGWHLAATSRAVARCYRVTAPRENVARYRADLQAVIDRERPALVLPVSEDIVHVAALAESLPRGCRLFSPPAAQLARLHDKLRFTQTAAAQGLTVPDSAAAGTPAAASIARAGRYVVKPRRGCSGAGLRFCAAGEAPPDGQDMLVQARIDGALRSSFAIVHGGRIVASSLYRGRVFDGTVAVGFERVAMPDAIADWVTRFAAAEAYTGFLAFDFIIDESGVPYAIECNPRATSGLHFFAAPDLARAITALPPKGTDHWHRRETRLQQFYGCLTVAQGCFGDWPAYRRTWGTILRARDVSWSWRDPLPFLLMIFSAYPILRRAVTQRISLGQAAMADFMV